MRHVLEILGKVFAFLLIIFICVVLFWLGPLVRLTLQAVAPAFLGTPVTMESLSINPIKGTLVLTDLRVGNYEQFNQPDLFRIKEVRAQVVMRSLFSDSIAVKRVEIDRPSFVFEQDGKADNINKLLANIAAYRSSKGPSKLTQHQEAKKSAKKGVIEYFKVSDGSISLVNTKHPELNVVFAFDRIQSTMNEGHIDVSGVSVSNPTGFVTRHVFELPMFGVSIDPSSLYSDQVVVTDVHVDSPRLCLEKGSEGTNVDRLVELAMQWATVAARFDRPVEKAPESLLKMEPNKTEVGAVEPESKVVVEQVRVNDLSVEMLNSGEGVVQVLEELCSVSDVSIRPEEGVLQVRGIYLLNPNGFVSPAIFGLKELGIRVDPATLGSDRVVIQDVKLSAPYVTLEQSRDSSTVVALLERIKWFVPLARSSAEQTSIMPEEEARPKASSKVWLESLVVDDFEIKMLRSGASAAPQKSSTMAGVKRIQFSAETESLSVSKLFVRNPAGYTAPNLFELNGVSVDLDLGSVGSTQMVVRAVQVAPLFVNLEQTPYAVNWVELMTFLNSLVPEKDARAGIRGADNALAVNPEKGTPLVVVRRVDFNGALVQLISMSKEGGRKTVIPFLGFDKITALPDRGLLDVAGFFVGNPQQFVAENLFELARFRVKVDPASLYAAPLDVEAVLMKEPVLSLEQTPEGMNLPVLMEMLKGVFPLSNDVAKDARASEDASLAPVLHRLAVEGARIMTVNAPDPTDPTEPRVFLGLDKLTLDLDEGAFVMTNLFVGNPQEFSSPSMLELGSLTVDIDPASLSSNITMVPEVLIDGVAIAYERQLMTDNINVLKDRIGAFFKLDQTEENSASAPKPAGKDKAKVIIDHLLVRNAAVKAKVSALPSATIPLDIELNGIGKERGGADLVELFAQLCSVFYQSVFGGVAGVTELAGDALKSSTLVGDTLRNPGGSVLNAGNLTLDVGEEVTGTPINLAKKPMGQTRKVAENSDPAEK